MDKKQNKFQYKDFGYLNHIWHHLKKRFNHLLNQDKKQTNLLYLPQIQ